MYRKCMSQRVRADRFGNPGPSPGFLARLLDGVLAEWLLWPLAREERRGRSGRAPPHAEQFEELRREHHVAIRLPLALLDANDHAAAIDIHRSETEHFGDAEAGCVAGGQNGAMLATGTQSRN